MFVNVVAYFINCLGDFTKFSILGHLGINMNLLDFEVKRSKVKGQSHDKTEYGQKALADSGGQSSDGPLNSSHVFSSKIVRTSRALY